MRSAASKVEGGGAPWAPRAATCALLKRPSEAPAWPICFRKKIDQ